MSLNESMYIAHYCKSLLYEIIREKNGDCGYQGRSQENTKTSVISETVEAFRPAGAGHDHNNEGTGVETTLRGPRTQH